jgi:hypothetical protein
MLRIRGSAGRGRRGDGVVGDVHSGGGASIPASAVSATPASSRSTRNSFAPACRRMKPTVAASSRVLTGQSTAPAIGAP